MSCFEQFSVSFQAYSNDTVYVQFSNNYKVWSADHVMCQVGVFLSPNVTQLQKNENYSLDLMQ